MNWWNVRIPPEAALSTHRERNSLSSVKVILQCRRPPQDFFCDVLIANFISVTKDCSSACFKDLSYLIGADIDHRANDYRKSFIGT
jgi:hypothetical protein